TYGAAEILLIPSTADVMAFCQRGSPGIVIANLIVRDGVINL
ncbi:hypothetical protein MAE30S32_36480, partial [Microcystis aeruginosa 11-30S32]